MNKHPFVVLMDEEPIQGHVFSTLKVKVGDDWMPVERRCVLCNSQPLDLLTTLGGLLGCDGKEVSR